MSKDRPGYEPRKKISGAGVRESGEGRRIHTLCEPIFRDLEKISNPQLKAQIQVAATEVNSRILNIYGEDPVGEEATEDEISGVRDFSDQLRVYSKFRDELDLADRQVLQEIKEYVDQILLPEILSIPGYEGEVKERPEDEPVEKPHEVLREVFGEISDLKSKSALFAVHVAVRQINRNLHWFDQTLGAEKVRRRIALENSLTDFNLIVEECMRTSNDDVKILGFIRRIVDKTVLKYLLRITTEEAEEKAKEEKALADAFARGRAAIAKAKASRADMPIQKTGSYTHGGRMGKGVRKK